MDNNNKIMSQMEVEIARMNLDGIESHLGHKVPSGMVDVTKLGDSVKSEYELFTIAQNIRSVEFAETYSVFMALLSIGMLVGLFLMIFIVMLIR